MTSDPIILHVDGRGLGANASDLIESMRAEAMTRAAIAKALVVADFLCTGSIEALAVLCGARLPAPVGLTAADPDWWRPRVEREPAGPVRDAVEALLAVVDGRDKVGAIKDVGTGTGLRLILASGWVFELFYDAGDLDYLEDVITPGGEALNVWDRWGDGSWEWPYDDAPLAYVLSWCGDALLHSAFGAPVRHPDWR